MTSTTVSAQIEAAAIANAVRGGDGRAINDALDAFLASPDVRSALAVLAHYAGQGDQRAESLAQFVATIAATEEWGVDV